MGDFVAHAIQHTSFVLKAIFICHLHFIYPVVARFVIKPHQVQVSLYFCLRDRLSLWVVCSQGQVQISQNLVLYLFSDIFVFDVTNMLI